ncbi:MAG: L-lactate permease [Bacteroidota bacterium]
MDQIVLAFLAFAPLLLIGILLVGLKWPAKRVMPIGLLSTIAIGYWIWKVPTAVILASSFQGLWIAADISIIIFGALSLLNMLKYSGALQTIKTDFLSLSEDYRIQTIIVAWLFGSLLEGAAGFGTPAAIVAPLLVSIGFPVGAALLAGMMTMSTAVTFGAIGTPILVGVKGGLKVTGDQILENGTTLESFITSVTQHAGIIHAIVGTFMPIVMIIMLNRFYGPRKRWKVSLEILPFLLLAGLSFTIPYALTAIYLGPEFPPIIGASFGLLFCSLLLKKSWSIPKRVVRFSDGPPQQTERSPTRRMPTWRAWLPYLMMALLLILSRMTSFELGSLLKSVKISFENILGTGISASSYPLYLPGSLMLMVFLVFVFIYRMPLSSTKVALSDAAKATLAAMIVLVFTLPMVRIFINSGSNGNEFFSMPVAIANTFSMYLGDLWIALAPIIGAFGAFIAGSNTISNLTFAELQYNIALNLGHPTAFIVALQAIGAAAGNMIAIHNVVAASATVGLVGKEGSVIRKTIIPTAYYLFCVVLLALMYMAIT